MITLRFTDLVFVSNRELSFIPDGIDSQAHAPAGRGHYKAWLVSIAAQPTSETSILLWTRSIIVQFSLLWDHAVASSTV